MNKSLFSLVFFSNRVLQKKISESLRFIIEKSGYQHLKWSELLKKHRLLIDYNYFDALKQCLENIIQQGLPHQQDQVFKDTFIYAASLYRFDIVRFLMASYPSYPYEFDYAMRYAVAGDDFTLLKEFEKKAYFFTNAQSNYVVAFNQAAYHARLEMLQWLLANCGSNVSKYNSHLFMSAINGGRLNVIQFLAEKHVNLLETDDIRLLELAAKGNHFEIFKILFDLKCRCSNTIIHLTAGHCSLEMLQWLLERRKVGFNSTTIDTAATNGKLENVQWIHANTTVQMTNEALDGAATNGHFETVKWIIDNTQIRGSKMAMRGAVGNGHIEIVQYLYDIMKNNPVVAIKENNKLLGIAVENGHLPLVQWLHFNISPIATITVEEMNRLAVRIDQWADIRFFETLKWIHENRTERCKESIVNRIIKETGSIKTIELLLSYNYGCTDKAFELASSRSYFEIIQFLHKNTKINCTDEALVFAVEHNSLEIVKYFHQNFPDLYLKNALRIAKKLDLDEIIEYLNEQTKIKQKIKE
ncbi:hypothetical protein PPL_04975 [Heterostelium album PN500]|uniref:Ankyrin repeat protein n=1 Tax=Heterostelium pallidum (strain ATCC 26659 / Pp 5 / PN500) TaxID=670386 RepID=D3B931_HETP5|nr:hypothetical protein PPL_04975 [Heterostelium album PN500]EFA82070.1 hypothetical protein PPL_04975 [Heterostelium album PN500]|eukprot:XP_020434187.1 hypothetical protein PPL_04975 [Heterostelium album PN500]